MKKFIDALNGIRIALNHKAVLIQFVLGLLAIIGGMVIKLDIYEWLAFVVCIAMVIMAEIFNTAVERIGNYICISKDEKIKEIKDLASGSVLVASIGALVICIIVVIRRIR